MTKITASTTLAELAMIFGKFGVRDCNIGIAVGADISRIYRVHLCTRDHSVVGDADLLYKAIDDALARLEHLIAEVYSRAAVE